MNRVTISFDFELGWGVLDSELWIQREQSSLYDNLRGHLDVVFEKLAEREVPTTWAMVAGMLAPPLAEEKLGYLPVGYRNAVLEFQKQAKSTTIDARDIIDNHWAKIESFSEVASHTATHLYPEVPGVDSDCYKKDVKMSLTLLEQFFGEKVRSLVFTRDDTTFLDSVATIGNLNLRTECLAYGNRSDGSVGRIIKGCKRYMSHVPPSIIEKSSMGCTTQSGSLYFNWYGGRYVFLKKLQLETQLNRLLHRLGTDEPGDYHVWLHPFNLAETPDHTSRFLWFIDRLVALRNSGQIEIVTMSEFSS